jgi:hypothetical protein
VSFPSNPELGKLGVTLLQTVRLNVVAIPPDPCVGQISFVDSSRNLVGNSLMTVNLNPGQATFLDLPGNTLVNKVGQRVEVQPVVTAFNSPGVANACLASAEVYLNGLGTTTAYFPPDPCAASSTCAAF